MNTEISLHFIGNENLWSEIQKKICYVIPYYDDDFRQQKLLKKVSIIFERLGEDYEVKYVYNNGTSYTGIEIDEAHFNEVKLDYLETELNRLKRIFNKEPRKKIIIEI